MDAPLNLLPAERQKELLQFQMWQNIIRLLIIPAILAFLLVLGSGVTLWQLERHQIDIKADEAKQVAAKTPSSDVTKLTQQVNDAARILRTTLPKSTDWSAEIVGILAAVPSDISLTKCTISATGAVTIEGVADTRASFLALQKSLTTTPLLKGAKTTDTASKRENIPFKYTASYVGPKS